MSNLNAKTNANFAIDDDFTLPDDLVAPPKLTIVGNTTPADATLESSFDASIDASASKAAISAAKDFAAEMERTYQQSAYTVLLQRKTPLLPLLSDHDLVAIVKGTSDICSPITLPKKPFINRVLDSYLAIRDSFRS